MHLNASLRMRQEGGMFESGACFTAAQIIGKKLRVWSAGDTQLVVADDKGKIKFRSEITELHLVPRGMGGGRANIEITNLMNYDRIYAFTDGVSDNVDIEQVILEMKGLRVEDAIKQLADMCKENMTPERQRRRDYRGSKDNITIIIYEILPVPLRGK